ncbi:MAG: hypothetical protein J0H74_18545 [Chitinophagaceae bacterium]|nr:hypothetical protein [Chitinophagaceae bacterium]
MEALSSKKTFLPSYWKFIWNTPENRNLLWFAAGASGFLFIIFKVFYPYPDFFSDSYSYIYAAYTNLNINIWPIGYSKFLSLFHRVTYSDTALIAFQYFTLQLSALHFLFTICYFFKLSEWTRNVIAVFLFINPLTLYLCNTINSDALFATLSLLWLSELIWIVYCPMFYQLLTQSLLLFLCFTIRNNAYYYPLVSAVALIISSQSKIRKIIGIVLPSLMIISFILFTREAAFKLTGTRQFSLFTGWQLANNALYIYDKVDVDSDIFSSREAKEINTTSERYFSGIRNHEGYRDFVESYVGNLYIREPKAPLKQYYAKHYFPKTTLEVVSAWAQVSVVFESFGKPIILSHPISYIQYFVLPNIKHYLLPPLSHIGLYNYGTNEIDPIAKLWFHYPTNKIHSISAEFQGNLLIIYKFFFFFVNLYFLFNLTFLIYKTKFNLKEFLSKKELPLVIFFLILNFGFSISTTVNILRYQYISMIILVSFTMVLNEYLSQYENDHSLYSRKRLEKKKVHA